MSCILRVEILILLLFKLIRKMENLLYESGKECGLVEMEKRKKRKKRKNRKKI